MIRTSIGPIPENLLAKSISEEDIPCGQAVTTTYRYQGEVVKQDIEIRVTKALEASGDAGFFQRLKQKIHDWSKV